MLLENRIALVTGASRGIGRAIATLFASHGAALVLCARGERLEETAAEIRDRGGRVLALRGDVHDATFARELIQQCRKEHGRLDVLVNNAGIMSAALLGMIQSKTIQEMFDVNILAGIQ